MFADAHAHTHTHTHAHVQVSYINVEKSLPVVPRTSQTAGHVYANVDEKQQQQQQKKVEPHLLVQAQPLCRIMLTFDITSISYCMQ